MSECHTDPLSVVLEERGYGYPWTGPMASSGREGARDLGRPWPHLADCASEDKADAGHKTIHFKLSSGAASPNQHQPDLGEHRSTRGVGSTTLSVNLETKQASLRRSSCSGLGYTQAICSRGFGCRGHQRPEYPGSPTPGEGEVVVVGMVMLFHSPAS